MQVFLRIQGLPHGTLQLQKPHDGKPFVISNKSLGTVIHSYQQNANGFKAAAYVFGGIGLVIFGTKLIQYGAFKWKERNIRQVVVTLGQVRCRVAI